MAFYEMLPGAGMPSGLQAGMDSVLNKKFGTSTTYPAEGWPDTVNLMGPLPEKTVSSSPIVTFSDGADTVPLKKCEITLPASLDGYSSVEVVSAGKNIADFSSNTQDGEYHATVTYQNNGASVSASGTYSRCAWTIPTIIGQTYTVSYSGVRDNEYGRVMFNDSNTASGVMAYGVLLLTSTEANYTKTFTATSDCLYLIIYNTGNTSTGTSTISNLMVEAGSTASTFEPYSPIDTHTASLGRTIYGGSVDVVSGSGESKNGLVTDFSTLRANGTSTSGAYRYIMDVSGMGDYNVGACISNLLNYRVSWNADVGEFYNTANVLVIFLSQDNETDAINYLSSNSCKVAYPLATAETFTFDPVPIDSKLGNNTIWSDSGDTEVTYRADINLALGGN